NPDPDFWLPDEWDTPALYVSRLAVQRDRAGQGLGHLILEWISDFAFRRLLSYVRLDTWRGPEAAGLHRYYERMGWTHLRTETPSHRGSGVLWQKATRPLAGDRRFQLAHGQKAQQIVPSRQGSDSEDLNQPHTHITDIRL